MKKGSQSLMKDIIGIPDGINTLIYTIIKHFLGTPMISQQRFTTSKSIKMSILK